MNRRGPFFPALPRPRLLPWVLAVLSVASLVYGAVKGDGSFVLLGVVGFAFVGLAYALARAIAGPPDGDGDP
jgi:hypothetical protein